MEVTYLLLYITPKVSKTIGVIATINKNTTKNKFIRYLCFIADFIHSGHHRLKMSSLSLEKNRLRSIDLATLAINVTTAFTIVNCLEHELLEGF